MNVQLLRVLDRVVAEAACIAITPLAWLLRLLSRIPPREPRRILLIKFFGFGSLIRALPLFRALRRRFPRARLEILTFAENLPLLERFGVFDRCLTVRAKAGLLTDLPRQIARLPLAKYDAVLDMEFFSNFSSFLAFLTQAPVRIGFYLRRSFRERALTRLVAYNASQHISEVFASLGRALEAGPIEPARCGVVREDDRQELNSLLARHGVRRDERIVVVNVNASDLCLERRWPPERFADLCRRLLDAEPARALFIGSGSERPYVESVVQAVGYPSLVNLAGETTLGTLAALLERAALLLANDSGPAHLADLIGTPTVALFGPESPAHYGMRGPKAANFFLGLYCSPCLNALNSKVAPCGGRNACMRAIPVADVLEACLLLLSGATPSPDLRSKWNGYGGRFSQKDWQDPPPSIP